MAIFDTDSYVAVNTTKGQVVCSGNDQRVIGESARMLVTGGIAKPSDPKMAREMRSVVCLPFREALKAHPDAVRSYFRMGGA